MKLMTKKKIKMAVILIILCIIFAGCGPNKDVSEQKTTESVVSLTDTENSYNKSTVNPMIIGMEEELIFRNEYIDYNDDYEVPYINSDEFYLKDGEEPPTSGRYANVTQDGKINWDIEETVRLDDTPIAKEMLSKVTLDGKKIALPLKFTDIDEEFAVFDNVDFTKLTDDMYSFTITDIKSGNKLFAFSPHGEGVRPVHILNKDNIPLLEVNINLNKNIIIGVTNDDAPYMAIKNLMVDGIGVGNTLNEVYEKFGMPKEYDPRINALPIMVYKYKDDQYMYKVFFHYEDEFHLDRDNVRKMKNNVVTAVSVFFKEVK